MNIYPHTEGENDLWLAPCDTALLESAYECFDSTTIIPREITNPTPNNSGIYDHFTSATLDLDTHTFPPYTLPSSYDMVLLDAYNLGLSHGITIAHQAPTSNLPSSHPLADMPTNTLLLASQTSEVNIDSENPFLLDPMADQSITHSMETQPPELSENPPIPCTYLPTTYSESTAVPASQAQTMQLHQQPPADPESAPISVTAFSSGGSETLKHRCEICGVMFRRPYRLRDHKRIHIDEETSGE